VPTDKPDDKVTIEVAALVKETPAERPEDKVTLHEYE